MTEFRAIAMASSDAEKRAMKKYAETEKGKTARQEAVKRYQETEEGKAKLKEAQKKYTSSDKWKAVQKAARLRRKERLKAQQEQQLNAEKSD